MKGKVLRIVIRTAFTFIVVLLISTAIQFAHWQFLQNHLDYVVQICPPDTKLLNEYKIKLGLDKPFVPDLWPFDNRSIWTGQSLWGGK